MRVLKINIFEKEDKIKDKNRKKTTLPKGVCVSEAQKLNKQVLRLLHII
ncbi:hypothetical protein [Clostridium felsineum]|nr:hypothetical protein [Clostridium felsineum]URZ04106.1 hypothetical protein CLAUR_041940 [Clostridium felsineum]